MSADLDAIVYDAVRGHTPADPQDLVGILGSVDGREKLVLEHGELEGALRRLIQSGKIGEASRHHFYELGDPANPTSFSGLTPEEHDAACARYKEAFWRKYREGSRD